MKISRYWHGLLLLAFGLAWSLPAGAAVIKNVQSGLYLFTPSPVAAQSTTTVNITSVNTARTFVVCQNRSQDSHDMTRATCVLTSPTTLVITIGGRTGIDTTNSTVTIQWYVVEFLSGVTVQRGLATLPASGGTSLLLNVTLSPAVNLAKSFVINSERINEDNDNTDERWTTRARLTTTTNLALDRNEAGTVLNVAWQVIQIESAYVQSGTTSIAAGSYSNNGGLTYEVPAGQGGSVVNRTFLAFSRMAGGAANGVEREYHISGRIQSTGLNVNFDRPSSPWTTAPTTPQTGTSTAWFAVRMTDGTTVQSGSNTTTSPGQTIIDVTLSPAIVINRSVPIISVRGDPATTTLNGDLDDVSWYAVFTSTTNLRLQRPSCTGCIATVSWFVVQFPDAIKGNAWNGLIDRREIYP
jgi:hypothetical protein